MFLVNITALILIKVFLYFTPDTVNQLQLLFFSENSGPSTRGQKRSSQTSSSSAKKKHKKGRGRPPKQSTWSRKDSDVSLQMETYDEADENWEPGGSYNTKPDYMESSGRPRRAKKRVSYREQNDNGEN